MLPCDRSTAARVAVTALTLLLAAAGPLSAQGDPTFERGIRTAIGYAGVLPDAMLGAGALHRFEGTRWGGFADVKTTSGSVTSDRDYCPAGARPPVVEACTIAAVEARWNDIPLRDVDEYLLVNAGVLRVLTEELALLVGVGLARPRLIREYAENINRELGEEPRVSEFGVYFAPLEEDPAWTPQLAVGALFRAGPRFLIRIGYETAPGGMSIGAYFVVR